MTANVVRVNKQHLMRRLLGPGPAARKRIRRTEAALEWTGTCRVCGYEISASMTDILKGCPNCNNRNEVANAHLPSEKSSDLTSP